MRSRLLAATASTVLITFLAACGGSDDPSADATPSAEVSSTAGSSASAPAADGTCTYEKKDEAGKKATLPPSEPKSVDSLTIKTNRGDIKLALKPDTAPCTVNSFVSLAEQGFFDGTKCHRLVPGFVLQCGDPTATGSGGPGYSFADELTGDETYDAGTLAMANAGPDTNGSQFFMVFTDSPGLTPNYNVFGTVDPDGLALLTKAAKEGDDGSHPAGGGVPNAGPIDITAVTIG